MINYEAIGILNRIKSEIKKKIHIASDVRDNFNADSAWHSRYTMEINVRNDDLSIIEKYIEDLEGVLNEAN